MSTLQAVEPGPWYFVFAQSARWWDSGRPSLLFRQKAVRRDGARSIAIRSAPFTLELPGPLHGVLDARHGWEKHPASLAALKAYPPARGPQ